MNVMMITHTPEPEMVVARAAKLCYSSVGIAELGEKISKEEAEKFVNMLASMNHYSPFEHATFTFGIEGVSRALLSQITRHRIASYSVKSMRYVVEQGSVVKSPKIKNSNYSSYVFDKAMEKSFEAYNDIVDTLKKDGFTEKEAIEEARAVLPHATETKMIVTMNARSLINFIKHRTCFRAQDEIRELAYEMLRLVKEISPSLFKNAGPSCYSGKCEEGKMSCGRQIEVRERLESLI